MNNRLFLPILIATALFVITLIFYGQAALNLPILFNLDNQNNYAATRYIAENNKIPIVDKDTKDIEFSEFGTTRSLRPPFTYIVTAIVSNLSLRFISLEDALNESVIRYRLGSSLIGALTVSISFIGFWIAFNHIGLAFFGSLLIALLPKFIFLTSSNNDDIGALLSVSLLFTSTLALLKYRRHSWALLPIALSTGLVLQTKYTAWLTLPWFGVFCLILVKSNWRKVAKMLPLLIVTCLLSGGWWLIFNMTNYGLSDPTALKHSAAIQHSLMDGIPNREGYSSQDVGYIDLLSNYDQFLSKSYRSFIGYIEWLELDIGNDLYLFYATIFLVGILAAVFRSHNSHKKTVYLDYLILIIIVNQLLFYIHHNWLRDIQPQARYVLPILMPLVYLFLRCLHQLPQGLIWLTYKDKVISTLTITSCTLSLIFVILFNHSWSHHIVPSYEVKPYFTSISNEKRIGINDAFKIISSNSLEYKFINSTLELQRTAGGSSTLELDSSFCELLPLNALIIADVFTPTNGGFDLRIQRQENQRFKDIIWHPLTIGNSTAVLSVNSKNCTGVKISLSKNTHQLTLKNLQIRELKIHEHGKPI